MGIIGMDGYRVVPMPIVKYSLYLIGRNRCCNDVGGSGVVGLPWCVLIDGCEINYTSRGSVCFAVTNILEHH